MERSDNEIIADLGSAYRNVTRAQRHLLDVIAECDRRGFWDDGAYRDMGHWLAANLGISSWVACKWIAAAHAIAGLPRISLAFESGELSIEKTVELTRFATPETERKLITWAKHVTVKTIRDRAAVEENPPVEEAIEKDRARYLSYWWAPDGALLLRGVFPPDQGAVVCRAIDRLAGRMPDILDADGEPEPHDGSLDARRADALFAMASKAIAEDQDSDRATVVVHATLESLRGGRGAEIENGPAVPSETFRRLLCDSRLQVVVHDDDGSIVGISETARTASPRLKRLLRQRDRGCTFPNCEASWFLHAHHIKHWRPDDPGTEPDNLVLLCHFHHKLVHEHAWVVQLQSDGTTRWWTPTGKPFTGTVAERAPPVAMTA